MSSGDQKRDDASDTSENEEEDDDEKHAPETKADARDDESPRELCVPPNPKMCIVFAYRDMLTQVCAAHCGQPLIAGAGPGFDHHLTLFAAETGQWFHIQCYNTYSDTDWCRHVNKFLDGSLYSSEAQARAVERIVKHWAFLHKCVPYQDLRIEATRWTQCFAPGQLEGFFLHIRQAYAKKTMWPDCLDFHQPGTTHRAYTTMFPTTELLEMRWVFLAPRTAGRGEKSTPAFTQLMQQLASCVEKAMGEGEVIVRIRLFSLNRVTEASAIWLVLDVAPVAGSPLAFAPLCRLAQGSMAAAFPQVRALVAATRVHVTDTAQELLNATTKTLPETGVNEWRLKAMHTRASVEAEEEERTCVAVGLTRNECTGAATSDIVHYVAVGEKSLIQYVLQPADPKNPIFTPFNAAHKEIHATNFPNIKGKYATTPLILQMEH